MFNHRLLFLLSHSQATYTVAAFIDIDNTINMSSRYQFKDIMKHESATNSHLKVLGFTFP